MRTCYGQWYPHPPWHLRAAFGPGKEALPVSWNFHLFSSFSDLQKNFFSASYHLFSGSFPWSQLTLFLEVSNQMKLLFCTSRAPECWGFHTVTPNIKLHKQHHLWTPGATTATVTLGTWFWGPVPDLRWHPGICIPNKVSTDTVEKILAWETGHRGLRSCPVSGWPHNLGQVTSCLLVSALLPPYRSFQKVISKVTSNPELLWFMKYLLGAH